MSPKYKNLLKVLGVVVAGGLLTVGGWAAMAYVVVWSAKCALE